MVSSPPSTSPVPKTLNGNESDSAETSTPSARSDVIVVSIGRFLAPASPSKVILPRLRVDNGGTKRITVPAKPQSIVEDAVKVAGETLGDVVPPPTTSEPKVCNAASIRLLSLETSAPAN